MRVVLLTGDQPNQRALANKLATVCDLTGLVLSRNIPRRRPRLGERARALVTGLESRVFGRSLRHAWHSVMAECRAQYPSFPTTPRTIRVDNVNDPETAMLIGAMAPDAVLVSGTNLVGPRLILGCGTTPLLNLHTGISPYVKGGPNCTNWCLAQRQFHLIGSTLMWLDAGIDTGDLIATERTPLTYQETLGELHLCVMNHAHDLYVRSIATMAATGSLPRIGQDRFGKGRTFFTREWNARAMVRAQRNFARFYAPSLLDDKAFRDSKVAAVVAPLRATASTT